MTQQISTSQAKTHFLELIRKFENESNDKIYITKRGKITAVLKPYRSGKKNLLENTIKKINEIANKQTLNLAKGETIKDLIEKGRR